MTIGTTALVLTLGKECDDFTGFLRMHGLIPEIQALLKRLFQLTNIFMPPGPSLCEDFSKWEIVVLVKVSTANTERFVSCTTLSQETG